MRFNNNTVFSQTIDNEIVKFSVEILRSGYLVITLPYRKFRLSQRIQYQYS